MLKTYKIRHYEQKIKTMTKEEAIEYLNYENKDNNIWEFLTLTAVILLLFATINDFKFWPFFLAITLFHTISVIKSVNEYIQMMLLIKKIQKGIIEIKK